MTDARLTRAEKKAETRERLLAAAIAIAERDGFAALTVNGVAAAAGLTKGAVYSNFASKEELLIEVADRLTPGLNVTSDLMGASDLADLLKRLGDAFIDMSRRRSRELVFAIEFEVLALRDPKVRAALRRRSRGEDPDEDDEVARLLHRSLDDLPFDEEHYVEAVNAVAWGLLLRRLVYGPGAMPDDVIRWTLSRLTP